MDCFASLAMPLSPERALGVHIQRIDRLARSHEQPVALEPAEAEVGAALGQRHAPRVALAPAEAEVGAALGPRDAADQHAAGRVDHDAVEFGTAHAPAAPQIAVDVAAHAVGRAGTGVDEYPFVGNFIAARR